MPATLTFNHNNVMDGVQVSGVKSVSGGLPQRIAHEPLAGNASNVQFDTAFKYATLQGFTLLCGQDCTIKTNSTSSPGNVIELVGGVPFDWYLGNGFSNPFTADVTKLYITNDSTGHVADYIDAIFINDVTP